MEAKVLKEYYKGGLFGSYKISKKTGIAEHKVRKILKHAETRQQFRKPKKKHIKYNKIYAGIPTFDDRLKKWRPQQFQADLADMHGRRKTKAPGG